MPPETAGDTSAYGQSCDSDVYHDYVKRTLHVYIHNVPYYLNEFS